jgi:periplasmic copper chaperone A
MRLVKAAVGSAFAVLAVAGCSAASASSSTTPSIAIPTAYINTPSDGVTYGYLDIRDNGAADKLVSVTMSVGGKVTFVGPTRTGTDPLAMHTVSSIPIAADAMTQLVPNNYHLLITDPGSMTAGHDITMTLTFARSGKVTILALVTDPETGGSSYFLN